MQRRGVVVSLTLAPVVFAQRVRTQPGRKVYRIGTLSFGGIRTGQTGTGPPVQSLARPGGNITGMRLQSTETIGKRLELLKELVPGVAPVAVLWYRAEPAHWQAAQAAARARRWKLLSLEVRGVGEIDAALKAAMDAGAGALLVLGGGVFFAHARRIAELAARQRLPSMFALRPLVEAGGLMSHGADLNDIWRRAATFVDKILRGAKPGDLPVEQPTRFEVMINLKTARAIGLTIPQSLLLRADEVIE